MVEGWLKDVQSGDAERRKRGLQRMLEENRGLIFHYLHRHYDAVDEDMVQTCQLALIRAAEAFDPRRGEFSTLACVYMRYELDHLFQYYSALHYPNYMRRAIGKMMKDGEDLEKVAEQMAQESGVKKQAIEKALKFARDTRFVSLDAPNEDGELFLHEMVGTDGMLERIEDIELARAVKQELDKLTSKERMAVQLRFGLDDGIERTYREVAQAMDMSTERVRQLCNKALEKLRASPVLQEWYDEL